MVASCLGHAWSGDDQAVVFVHRLAMDLNVDTFSDRTAIASACARAFARELVREVASGASDNVIRFANRAGHIASYVSTRARGDDARHWFFASFCGWEGLSRSAAIRAALCDDPSTGRAALAALDEPALAAVATALGGSDALEITRALAPRAIAGDRVATLRSLLRTGVAASPSPRVLTSPGLTVWLLATSQVDVDASLLADGARLLHTLDTAAVASAVPLAALVEAVCADTARLVAFHAAGGAGAPDVVNAHIPPANGSLGRRSTRWGGPFLLLDDLGALPLGEVAAEWPGIEGTAAVDLLRLIVLGHCLGATRWTRLVEDPFWRNLWRVAPAIASSTLVAWLADLGGRKLRDMRAALARSVGAAAEGKALAAGVELSGRPWRVLVGHDGLWSAVNHGRAVRARVAEASDDDLAYLVDASGLLPKRWATLFAVAAQQTLRRFARRLPGFTGSRCEYLHSNFLDVSATMESDVRRVTIILSRPPLELVLSLSGRNRGQRRWPFLDERPFALFSEE